MFAENFISSIFVLTVLGSFCFSGRSRYVEEGGSAFAVIMINQDMV